LRYLCFKLFSGEFIVILNISFYFSHYVYYAYDFHDK